MTPQELKNFMLKHRIREGRLSEILGVTKGAVSHWLNARRDIPETTARVIRMFDETPAWINVFEGYASENWTEEVS